jgi:TIR domain-containing protein/FHA domain-containing protein
MKFEEQNTRFVITREDLNADPISLVTEGLKIGRSESCELKLNHPTVSRLHAGISQAARRFYFYNFSHLSGTTLNGRSVAFESAEALADGDVIQIGPFLLHIKFEDRTLCLHVQRLTGEPWERDRHAHALDQFWDKRIREAGKMVRPSPLFPRGLAPRLPPHTGLRRISQTLRTILRRVIAGFAQGDVVDFTVFSPPVVTNGEMFMVQVFVHRPEQTEVAQLAKEFDADTARRGFTRLEAEVEQDEQLMVHLSLPGLGFSSREYLRWHGVPRAVQFAVLVPAVLAGRNVVGTVMISKDHVPLGHIKFKLTVEPAGAIPNAAKSGPSGESARRYRKAFISYASQDRAEVIKRVQMLARLKINYFQDVLDLEPGTRWQQELYRHIDDSDLFLLFWSSAARQSQWVMREVNYALKQQSSSAMKLPEIIPVIIEGPPPVEPPPELAHLHFNDYLIYFTR